MAGALILADQPLGAGAGTAGVAREDIWKDREIDLSCPEPGNTSYAWYLLSKPGGSTATLDTPIEPTASFTPDKVGTYRIRLIVNGGGTGNTMTLVYRCRYDSVGVLLERGWALPAIGEVEGEANYNSNDRAWAEPIESMRDDILAILGDGASPTLVYHPGGETSGNVFESWSDLMTVFAGVNGTVEILIDDSDTSPAVIPEGTWDLEDRAVLVGAVSPVKTGLTVGDGAATYLQRPSGFKHLHIYNAANGYIGSPTVPIRFDAEEVTFQASAAGRLILASEGSKIHLRGKSILSNTTTEVCLELEDGGLLDGNTNVDVYVEDFSYVATDCLKVYATDTLTVYLSNSSVSCSETQTDVAGTLTVVYPPPPAGAIFIYQPGGTPAGNIYDDWSDLMAAHSGVKGPKIIELDPTEDANLRCDIPSGTWALGNNTVLRGMWAQAEGSVTLPTRVVMADGAQFQDAAVVEGGVWIWSASTDVVFTWSGDIKHLVLRNNVRLYGTQYTGLAAPTSELIFGYGIEIDVHDDCKLLASSGDQAILETDTESSNIVNLYDRGWVGAADGGVGASAAFTVGVDATMVVKIHSQGAYFQHAAVVGLLWLPYCVRQYVIPLSKSLNVNATITPVTVGGAYVSYKHIPKHINMKCKFRAVLETTDGSVGYEAYLDLLDVHGQLNAGTPSVVTGSQLDTTSSDVPLGAPASNPLVTSVYEADITSAIIDGTWVSDGLLLEARLWIGTAAGGTAATCKSAELVFEWTELTPLAV